jgi:hypothetical protein
MARAPVTLETALRAGAPPLVMLIGETQHAFPLALARASGVALTKRALFHGSAHPTFLGCVPIASKGRALSLLDASAMWRIEIANLFNPYVVPGFLRASARAALGLFRFSDADSHALVILRVARHFGLRRIIAVVDDAAEAAAARNRLAEIDRSFATAPVLVMPLAKSASAKAQVASSLDAISEHLDLRPPASAKVWIGEVTGFGAAPSAYRLAISDAPALFKVGQKLDVLATDRNVPTTIHELDDKAGIIFKAAGLSAKAVAGLAEPGAASVVGTANIDGEATAPQGSLFAFDAAFGPCNLVGRTMSLLPDPLRFPPKPRLLVRAPGSPLMIGHEDATKIIGVTLARFV